MNGLITSIRPKQWFKNLFVLAPAVFEEVTDPVTLLQCAAASVLFCGVSSAVYLLNDVLDRRRDREHPLKKRRPIAAGEVSIPIALGTSGTMGILSMVCAYHLNPLFCLSMGVYIVLNLLYCTGIKNVIILDVMAIAAGFVIRVEAGGIIVGVPSTPWIVLTTFFLALFLALAKRRAEILALGNRASGHREVLGQYTVPMLDRLLLTTGSCTAIAYAMFAVLTRPAPWMRTRPPIPRACTATQSGVGNSYAAPTGARDWT